MVALTDTVGGVGINAKVAQFVGRGAGAVDLPEALVDVVWPPDVLAVGVGDVAAGGGGVAADA